MDLAEFIAKHKTITDSDYSELRDFYYSADSLEHCCGIKVIELRGIPELDKPWTLRQLKDYFKVILNHSTNSNRAGLILSDNTKRGGIRVLLNKIITPMYIGKNDPHSSKIYLWVIPFSKLK